MTDIHIALTSGQMYLLLLQVINCTLCNFIYTYKNPHLFFRAAWKIKMLMGRYIIWSIPIDMIYLLLAINMSNPGSPWHHTWGLKRGASVEYCYCYKWINIEKKYDAIESLLRVWLKKETSK